MTMHPQRLPPPVPVPASMRLPEALAQLLELLPACLLLQLL